MASSPLSSSTLLGSSSPGEAASQDLDLSILPPLFVLPTHLDSEDLHRIEDQVQDYGGPLTFDITEAKIVVGRVGTKARAQFELRSRQLWTEAIIQPPTKSDNSDDVGGPPRKRPRIQDQSNLSKTQQKKPAIDDSETESETESEQESAVRRAPEPASSTVDSQKTLSPSPEPAKSLEIPFSAEQFLDRITVVKLEWLEESFSSRKLLPIKPYTVYEGRAIAVPVTETPKAPSSRFSQHKATSSAPLSQRNLADRPHTAHEILERAKADAASGPSRSGLSHYSSSRHRNLHEKTSGQQDNIPAKLPQRTTSEYEGTDSEIPPPPIWIKRKAKYSCQRHTPYNPPNEAFIEQLKEIRLGRTLIGDEIGVRAYSTSIASIAAYPFKLTNPKEIVRLPGCDVKIANLWIEFANTGSIRVVKEQESDEHMQCLKQFYNIWGVGAETARQFADRQGWHDLDEVIEQGWDSLTRVQQIGLKYYEEFLQPIPRAEVEAIAAVVKEHGIRVRDFGIEVCIVGGYRRGKAASGDVDIIVSHRQLDATHNLINEIVASLESEHWITHTLTLNTTGSDRDQATLPFKPKGVKRAGFDTLDKALVVWQDPNYPAGAEKNGKNPNVHRRVDIIVSPWRTVGCAVLGWSGGTTFQRDIRRYVDKVKGWKFDSSGIRVRSTGQVVELEGPDGVPEGKSMEDAEKAVFEGMGLEWIPPVDRCTG